MNAAVKVFVAFTYAASIAIGAAVGFTGGHQSLLRPLSFITMFIPAVGVIVVGVTTGERVLVDWRLPPRRYLLLALFLMPAAMHAVMLPVTIFLTAGVPWQDWLTHRDDSVFRSPAQLGWGALGFNDLVVHMIINALIGVLLVSFLAFFEEIGWRAYLLQTLAERMGQQKAVTVVTATWSLWHIPFVLSGILYFTNVSRSEALAIMPVGEFGAGLVIGWFWIRTKSIWIVSLAHGALNDWGQYAFKFMKDEPISVWGTVFRSYDTIVLASGSLALVVLGGLLVLWHNPDSLRTSDRITDCR